MNVYLAVALFIVPALIMYGIMCLVFWRDEVHAREWRRQQLHDKWTA